jgi:hypothetical protein
MAKRITWIAAAEIAGMSVRNVERKRQACSTATMDCSTSGAGSAASTGCRWRTAEQVLALYRDKYADFNVRHFHEKLKESEGVALSYS